MDYLEAGCGTGHFLVGVASRRANWRCHGIDLSAASLSIAEQLAAKHGTHVTVAQQSYLDELPFAEEQFDIISAQGTIHHCDDPAGAMRNLKRYLKPDGAFDMHVYGARLDAGKFDLKEAISIFESDHGAYAALFQNYEALLDHQDRLARWKRWLDISPLDIFRYLRTQWRNARRRNAEIAWSPPWTDRYPEPDSAWRDHFCHPCERAYEVPEIEGLVTDAGFEVVEMRAQGRVNATLVPPQLQQRFDALSDWQRWRLMELLGPARSFSMTLRKLR